MARLRHDTSTTDVPLGGLHARLQGGRVDANVGGDEHGAVVVATLRLLQ